MPRLPSIDLGPLPVEVINAALGTELEPGRARLSAAAHAHMAADHPGNYAACLAALPDAVSAPSFIGQAPGQTRNFELVRRIGRPDGQAVLVAVAIDQDETGEYWVRTCYLISAETVDQRRRTGRLKGRAVGLIRQRPGTAAEPCVFERDAIPDLLAGSLPGAQQELDAG